MTNDSRTISPPLQNLLCVVDGNKISTQGTTGGTPLPVVHNALTKTQAESLRRRECNRLVLRPEYSNFPVSSVSEIKGEEECNSAKNDL